MKKYKKFYALILMVVIILVSLMPVWAETATVYLDNEKMEFDVEPIMVNERILVPLRAIFEKLGAVVDWDDVTQTAYAKKGDVKVNISIDDATLNKIEVSDKKLSSMYKVLPEKSGLWMKAQHILISKTEDGSGLKKAELMLADLKANPSKFKKVMFDYSEDPGSLAQPDGYVFTVGEMVTEFYNGALKTPVGQISDIVESPYGYHIIKKVAQWENGISFEDMEQIIINKYLQNDLQKITLDVPAQLVGERTLAPLRAVSEAFGCDVKWDDATQSAYIYSKEDAPKDIEKENIDTLREAIITNAEQTNHYLRKIATDIKYDKNRVNYTALTYDAQVDEVYIESVAEYDDGNKSATLIYLEDMQNMADGNKGVVYLLIEPSGNTVLGSAEVNTKTFSEKSKITFGRYETATGEGAQEKDQESCAELMKTGLNEANQILAKYNIPLDMTDFGFANFKK